MGGKKVENLLNEKRRSRLDCFNHRSKGILKKLYQLAYVSGCGVHLVIEAEDGSVYEFHRHMNETLRKDLVDSLAQQQQELQQFSGAGTPIAIANSNSASARSDGDVSSLTTEVEVRRKPVRVSDKRFFFNGLEILDTGLPVTPAQRAAILEPSSASCPCFDCLHRFSSRRFDALLPFAPPQPHPPLTCPSPLPLPSASNGIPAQPLDHKNAYVRTAPPPLPTISTHHVDLQRSAAAAVKNNNMNHHQVAPPTQTLVGVSDHKQQQRHQPHFLHRSLTYVNNNVNDQIGATAISPSSIFAHQSPPTFRDQKLQRQQSWPMEQRQHGSSVNGRNGNVLLQPPQQMQQRPEQQQHGSMSSPPVAYNYYVAAAGPRASHPAAAVAHRIGDNNMSSHESQQQQWAPHAYHGHPAVQQQKIDVDVNEQHHLRMPTAEFETGVDVSQQQQQQLQQQPWSFDTTSTNSYSSSSNASADRNADLANINYACNNGRLPPPPPQMDVTSYNYLTSTYDNSANVNNAEMYKNYGNGNYSSSSSSSSGITGNVHVAEKEKEGRWQEATEEEEMFNSFDDAVNEFLQKMMAN